MSHLFRSVGVGVVLVCCVCASTVHAAVNINTASLDLLDTLPGVGPTTAQYIIDGRPYASVADISTVKGIGEPGSKSYEDIIDLITVSDGDSDTLPDAAPEAAAEEESAEPEEGHGGGIFIDDTLSIFVDAGVDRTVFVGADSVFEARVVGAQGLPVEHARVVWSFGNGERREGARVLYNFAFPGTYVVTADAANEVYSATDRVVVTAIPDAMAVTEVTGEYIALTNGSEHDIDIGGWLLFALGTQFQFPQHTVILSGQEVLVSNRRTGLSGADPSTVALQYPNGVVAARYEYPLFLAKAATPSPAPAPREPAVPREPAPESLVSNASLMTSPAAASHGTSGVWAWILSVAILAGGAGLVLVSVRKQRRTLYMVEEHEYDARARVGTDPYAP